MVNFNAEMVRMEYDSIKTIVDAYSKQISDIEKELAGFDERKKQLQKSLKKFKSKFDMWNKMLKATEVPDDDTVEESVAEEVAPIEEVVSTTVEPDKPVVEEDDTDASFPVEEVMVEDSDDSSDFPIDDFDWNN